VPSSACLSCRSFWSDGCEALFHRRGAQSRNRTDRAT
jgi:hypothetical protein